MSKAPRPQSPPTFDQRIALLQDRREREWRQHLSIRGWVHETVNFANDANKDTLDDWSVSMFWVRLYGVLYDLRVHWQRVAERRQQRGLDPSIFEQLVASTNAVNAALSEKHRLCLEHRRHWTVHPVLNDFRVTETTDGAIRDKRAARLVGNRATSMDDYDDVLMDMVRHDDHKGNARDISRPLLQPLYALFELVQQVYPQVPLSAFHDVEGG
jgi:hypothetical protein